MSLGENALIEIRTIHYPDLMLHSPVSSQALPPHPQAVDRLLEHDIGVLSGTTAFGYLHAQRADKEGNVQLWGALGDSPWSVRACKKIIVSVEEIVSREDIGKDPNRTVIPAYKVAAVVKEPYGAHPKAIQGYYHEDRDFLFEYVKKTKTEAGWHEFMDEWVYGVTDRAEYMEKFINKYGFKKHRDWHAENVQSGSVNYGY